MLEYAWSLWAVTAASSISSTNAGSFSLKYVVGPKDADRLYVRNLSGRRLFSTWLGGRAYRRVWIFSFYDVVADDACVAPF